MATKKTIKTAAQMLGAAGGRARAENLSPAELSRIGRLAARAKYGRRRKRKPTSTAPSN